MSRRNRVRNRGRKPRPNSTVIYLQIGLLVGTLVFLYVFADDIAAGASNLVSELTETRTAEERAASSDARSRDPSSALRAPTHIPSETYESTDSGIKETSADTRSGP